MEQGHPIQRIELNFEAACKSYDMLCEKYPRRTVRFFSIVKEEVRKRGPIISAEERKPKC